MKTLSTLKAATRHPLFQPICAIVIVMAAALFLAPEAGFALPFVVGATLTEGKHTAEFLVSEANGTRSRDTVTVTVGAATTLAPGTVLAQLSGSGKYVPYDNTGSDGSEVAAGILYAELANAGAEADQDGVIVDADAEVRDADLVWAAGATADDKTVGKTDLRALGIKAR